MTGRRGKAPIYGGPRAVREGRTSGALAVLRDIVARIIKGAPPESCAERLGAVLDSFPPDGKTTALLACSELSLVPKSTDQACLDLTEELVKCCMEWMVRDEASNTHLGFDQ